MAKKIYDLAKQTQAANKQKILKTSTGKEYNVSFRPAIIDRKYYKRWAEIQSEILKDVTKIQAIQHRAKTELKVTDEDQEAIKSFKEIASEAAETGEQLIITTIKANGYDEFDEDELFTNFSESDMAYAVNIIMDVDVEAINKIKKNSKSKLKNSKTGK